MRFPSPAATGDESAVIIEDFRDLGQAASRMIPGFRAARWEDLDG
jgi:hypothetical protein